MLFVPIPLWPEAELLEYNEAQKVIEKSIDKYLIEIEVLKELLMQKKRKRHEKAEYDALLRLANIIMSK